MYQHFSEVVNPGHPEEETGNVTNQLPSSDFEWKRTGKISLSRM
jgi:hypothetical protein